MTSLDMLILMDKILVEVIVAGKDLILKIFLRVLDLMIYLADLTEEKEKKKEVLELI